jgi:hypothetical protein
MSNLKVIRYDAKQKRAWDDFVAGAKTGVFLFRRDYVEYHVDRFPDASLMFYNDADRLVGLLPATELEGRKLSSHAGLTFGGIISDDSMKVGLMLELFEAMITHLRAEGVQALSYKAIPHIYHRLPAEEDLYALYRSGARLVRRDVSSAISVSERPPLSKGRKWAIKQAIKNELQVQRSFDFEAFMAIEERVLDSKYNTKPVHTPAEMKMLAERFPDNIKLFTARGAELLAGVIVFESDCVAHAQYISASDEGKRTGALDLIINYLINDYYLAKRYFDFGISTEDAGRVLNVGLVENKQSFGARAVVHDFYELELNNY